MKIEKLVKNLKMVGLRYPNSVVLACSAAGELFTITFREENGSESTAKINEKEGWVKSGRP